MKYLCIVFVLTMTLLSCESDLNLNAEDENVEISLRGDGLNCIDNCNAIKNNCLSGGGAIGESYSEIYAYYLCRCVSENDDCTWMGSWPKYYEIIGPKIVGQPRNICDNIQEYLLDWSENCTISYLDCINSCDYGDDDNTVDDCTSNFKCPPGECCQNGKCRPC